MDWSQVARIDLLANAGDGLLQFLGAGGGVVLETTNSKVIQAIRRMNLVPIERRKNGGIESWMDWAKVTQVVFIQYASEIADDVIPAAELVAQIGNRPAGGGFVVRQEWIDAVRRVVAGE